MSNHRRAKLYPSERLAYWYFRLNGFFTIENFVVHSDSGSNQGTDADLLAVRFLHRRENLQRPMLDDEKVIACTSLANVIIAEVKTGPCALNGPWTDPAKNNMERVLRAIGCVPDDETEDARAVLYRGGIWSNSTSMLRLFAIGESRQPDLPIPCEQQLTWNEIIGFCVRRLKEYRIEKSSIGQWSPDGLRLQELACGRDPEQEIRVAFRLSL